MKKFLMFFLFLALSFGAVNAQVNKVWEISAGGPSAPAWFTTSTNITSLVYNPATGNLLCAERGGNIYVLDTTDGAVIDTLDNGTNGDGYRHAKVRVDANGVIYSTSMITGAGMLNIWRWENESAVPDTAARIQISNRMGEAFAVTGTGAGTILYLSGGTATYRMYILTTADGYTFTKTDSIVATDNRFNRAIEPLTNSLASDLWINSNGAVTRKIASDGAVISSVISGTGDGQIHSNYSSLNYLKAGNEEFIIGSASNAVGYRRNARMINVTNTGAYKTFQQFDLTNTEMANGGPFGDVTFIPNGDGTYEVCIMLNNNGMARFSTKVPTYAPLFASYGVPYYTLKDSVVISCASSLSKIYYTLDGSDPDSVNGILYTEPLVFTSSDTIKAIAYSLLREESEISSYIVNIPTVQAPAPEIALESLHYILQMQAVNITSGLGGAEIYYTTDNSEPDFNSSEYIATFFVPFGTIVKAVVYHPDYTKSETAVDTAYMPAEKAPVAVFDPVGGYFDTDTLIVKLSHSDSTAVLIYTLDESDPSHLNGDVYEDSIIVVPDALGMRFVKVIAFAEGYLPSDIAEEVYFFPTGPQVDTPVIFANYDYYSNYYEVGATCPDDSAAIYYTVDGTNPIPGKAPLLDSIIIVTETNTMVKVVAWRPGFSMSAIDSMLIEFPPDTVPTPTFNPPAMAIEDSIYVEIACADTLAEIYYSFDGTYENAVLYTEPLYIGPGTTIYAIAFKPETVKSPIVSASYPYKEAQFYTIWAQTDHYNGLPAYFGAGTERGLAYGNIGGKDRVFVVTRTAPPRIIVHDAYTGEIETTMNKPAVDLGYFPINCVEISADAKIYVANMTLNAQTAPFAVYRYDSVGATPVKVIEYTSPEAARLGDQLTVTGQASDNSLTIYTAYNSSNKIIKFTTTDNGATFTPQVITLGITDVSFVGNVAPLADGTFYFKSGGRPCIYFAADGTPIDTIPTSVLPLHGAKIRYFEFNEEKYVATYNYDFTGSGDKERIIFADVTKGNKNAYAVARTISIGNEVNSNAGGSFTVTEIDDETLVVHMLGCNNGIAAFTNNPNFVIGNYDTLFYGNSPALYTVQGGWGYVSGTNNYGDLGKYQRLDFNANDKIKALFYYFGPVGINGDPDTVDLVIRSVSSGAPGDLLYKKQILTDEIRSFTPNLFIFDELKTVTGPVFAGVEWSPTVNDTFGLISDQNGQGEGQARAWEKWDNGSFYAMSSASAWNLNADLWIGAYYKKYPVAVDQENFVLPETYTLYQNYPNPFNPSTTIQFFLQSDANVTLKVFNILGQEVATLLNRHMKSGMHQAAFNASRLASGVYIYKLEAKGIDGKNFSSVKKMMLLK